MQKKEIIYRLSELNEKNILTEDEKMALHNAILIIKKSNKKENLIKAIEILAKLLVAGSKLFDP